MTVTLPQDKALPRQDRAKAKRALILATVETLLSDIAPDKLKVREIARHANISVGSIYRYFENTDAILRALFDTMNTGTVEALESMTGDAPADWRARVDDVMDVVTQMHMSHPKYGRLMRYLDHRPSGDDQVFVRLNYLIAQAAELPEAQVRRIAETVIDIMEGVERRIDRLSPDGRSNAFHEARKAMKAYLALYLD